MQAFFRGFGHPEDVADRVFDMLDVDGKGEVNYSEFMQHFDPVLGPQFRRARRAPLIQVDDSALEKEINDIAYIIQERLTTKYKTVHDAFRALDLNKDGDVCLSETRRFIRNFGMPPDKADKIFKALDKDGSGSIQYDEFVSIFGAERKPQQKTLRPML